MVELTRWYQATCRKHSIGFFQIGGGIAGDFPICVVPMLEQSLKFTMHSALGSRSSCSDTRTLLGNQYAGVHAFQVETLVSPTSRVRREYGS